MHPETLFNASGKLAMADWALLVLVPRWRWSQRIASPIIPLTLAIAYLVLISGFMSVYTTTCFY